MATPDLQLTRAQHQSRIAAYIAAHARLPQEMFDAIAQHFDKKALVNCCLVSKAWMYRFGHERWKDVHLRFARSPATSLAIANLFKDGRVSDGLRDNLK
jgi:hypothetical protein